MQSYKVQRLDGESVYVQISYAYGSLKGGHNMANATIVFHLQWADGELEFVGHEKS